MAISTEIKIRRPRLTRRTVDNVKYVSRPDTIGKKLKAAADLATGITATSKITKTATSLNL